MECSRHGWFDRLPGTHEVAALVNECLALLIRGQFPEDRCRNVLREIQDGLVIVRVRVGRLVEECVERVVLAMRERVVLVRVTLGASPSHPHPRLASGGNAILDRGDTVFLVVRSAFGVVHGVAMEAGGDEFFVRGLAEQVPGELENGEAVERHVLVQRFDDPVPIRPDGPEGVLLVAHGIRVAGKVKPHACPTLAEGAGIQQSIHQGFVSIGRSVGYERIYRFWSRRETG